MKRILSALLALCFAVPAWAQLLGPPQNISVIDSGTACVTAPAACATFDVNTSTSVALDVSGTWSATLTFEGTTNGGSWRSILVTNTNTGAKATTTTAAGTFAIPNSGFIQVRARATAYASGMAIVTATRGFATANVPTPNFPASFTTGDLVYASTTTTVAGLSDVAAGQVLVSGGVGAAPAYSSSPALTSLSLGAIPATQGFLRGPNSDYLYQRNAANSNDLLVIGVDSTNTILLGSTGGSATVAGGTGSSVNFGASANPWLTGWFTTMHAGSYSLALTSAQPADQTGNATATLKMNGLGSAAAPCTITPTATGRVVFHVEGDVTNSIILDGISFKLVYGTGAAPANAAAATGTAITALRGPAVPVAAQKQAFTAEGMATGLALSTAVWYDLQIADVTGGTASASNVTCTAHEI